MGIDSAFARTPTAVVVAALLSLAPSARAAVRVAVGDPLCFSFALHSDADAPVRAIVDYAIGFPRPGTWHVRFNSDWSGYSPDFGNHHSYDTTAAPGGADLLPCRGNVGIGHYTAIILSQ